MHDNRSKSKFLIGTTTNILEKQLASSKRAEQVMILEDDQMSFDKG